MDTKITTCLTPYQKPETVTIIKHSGIWTRKKDCWHFQLNDPILQSSLTAAEGYPIIFKNDRITHKGFIVGWNSSDIGFYTSVNTQCIS